MRARSFHAAGVLVTIQQRLEAAGDEAAAEALHHFHRLSPDELELLVALEVGVTEVVAA
jgi:hypothetical protein